MNGTIKFVQIFAHRWIQIAVEWNKWINSCFRKLNKFNKLLYVHLTKFNQNTKYWLRSTQLFCVYCNRKRTNYISLAFVRTYTQIRNNGVKCIAIVYGMNLLNSPLFLVNALWVALMIRFSDKWLGSTTKIGQSRLNFELVVFLLSLEKVLPKLFHIWFLQQNKSNLNHGTLPIILCFGFIVNSLLRSFIIMEFCSSNHF